ncbi:hypothetical protein [Roseospira marina]|uniref:hypothetical protein n=1 Tax=Roseospira marina TaxID=140057 RepID=UPI001478700B|nr:hypothetical protein [Roseospira marina]MBB4314987.1 hypothetical protein [Roseospira marina]MBB5087987.1 hypothetical protein [Roseospira marina]
MARRRGRFTGDDSSGVLLKALALLLLGLVVAGGALLATWDMKPPTRAVEEVIPNDRF